MDEGRERRRSTVLLWTQRENTPPLEPRPHGHDGGFLEREECRSSGRQYAIVAEKLEAW